MIRKILGILCIALFIGSAFAVAEAKNVKKYDYKIVSQNGEEVYITGNFGNYNEAQDKGKNRVTFYNASVYDANGNLVGIAEVINYNAKSNNGAHVKWMETQEEVETPEEQVVNETTEVENTTVDVVNETEEVVNESTDDPVEEVVNETLVVENSTQEEIIINETNDEPVEEVVNDTPVVVENNAEEVVVVNNTTVNTPEEVNNTAVVEDLNSTPDKLVDDTVDDNNSTEEVDDSLPMEKTGLGVTILIAAAIVLVAVVCIRRK